MKTSVTILLLGINLLGGIPTRSTPTLVSAFSSPLKNRNRHSVPSVLKRNPVKVPLSQSASTESLESGEEEGKQAISAATFSLVKATVGSGVLSLSCKKMTG